jgi:hypothetical protein
VSARAGTGTRRGRGRGQVVSGYPSSARLDLPAAGSRPEGGLPAPIPEAALYRPVAQWLTRLGFVCWRDVSYLGCWIDLFAERSDGETIAVELKVTNWKRGLRQAQIVRPAVNRTYLGVWAPYVHRAQSRAATETMEKTGVGLLSINGHCKMLQPATRGQAPYRRWIVPPARASHRPTS